MLPGVPPAPGYPSTPAVTPAPASPARALLNEKDEQHALAEMRRQLETSEFQNKAKDKQLNEKDKQLNEKDKQLAEMRAKQMETDKKLDILATQIQALSAQRAPATGATSIEVLTEVSRAAATAATKAAVEAMGQQNARAAARPDKASLPPMLKQKDLMALQPGQRAESLARWFAEMRHQCGGNWNEVKAVWNSRIDLVTIQPASFASFESFKDAAVRELLRTECVDMTWLLLNMPVVGSSRSPAEVWELYMKVAILADPPELLVKPANIAFAQDRIGLLEAEGILPLFIKETGSSLPAAARERFMDHYGKTKRLSRWEVYEILMNVGMLEKKERPKAGADTTTAGATTPGGQPQGRGAPSGQGPGSRPFLWVLPHNRDKCYWCWGDNHRKPECPRRAAGKPRLAQPGAPGQQQGAGRGTPINQGHAAQGQRRTTKTAAAEAEEYIGEEMPSDTEADFEPDEGAHDKPAQPYLSRTELLGRVAAAAALNKGLRQPLAARLRIGGRMTSTTIDSGSGACLLTRHALRAMPGGESMLRPSRAKVLSVSGDIVPVAGEATLVVDLDEPRAVRFLVVDEAPHEALLGNDLMAQLRMSIKVHKGVIKIGNRRFAVSAGSATAAEKGARATVITAAKDYHCPPNTITVVATEGDFETEEVFTVADKSIQLAEGLYLIEGLHKTENSRLSRAALVNVNPDRAIRIPKGKALGRAENRTTGVKVFAAATEAESKRAGPRTPDDSDTTQVTEDEIRKHVAGIQGLDDRQRARVLQILLKYRWHFRTDLARAGAADLEPMKVVTRDEEPTQARGPRLSPKEKEAERAEVEKMFKANVVEETRGKWSSPVLMVKKPDQTIRFCIDFRQLNRKTVKDPYPLPRIDESLDKLGKAKWFSSFDLAAGYWQVPLDPESREKTGFTVAGLGRFHFLVVPMGLTNAPAHFQRAMDSLLAGLCECLVYLDDVLIYTATVDEHLAALENYFARLAKAGLLLKWKKCNLLKNEVKFLGYRVSADGVRVDPDRIKAISEMAEPKTVTEVRRFVAMCNYVRQFIEQFAGIAEPLHELTRQGAKWVWGPAQRAAFKELKRRLTSAPILGHPNTDLPFLLETDAAEGKGKQRSTIGAALCQMQGGKKRVIAYGSKTLDRAATESYRRKTGELELYSVVYWCKYWRHYLHGSEFTVTTDHEPVRGFLNPDKSAKATLEPGRVARFTLKMEEFRPKMTLVWRKGKDNVLADAMTRPPVASGGQEDGPEAATAAPATATTRTKKRRRWGKKKVTIVAPVRTRAEEKKEEKKAAPAPAPAAAEKKEEEKAAPAPAPAAAEKKEEKKAAPAPAPAAAEKKEEKKAAPAPAPAAAGKKEEKKEEKAAPAPAPAAAEKKEEKKAAPAPAPAAAEKREEKKGSAPASRAEAEAESAAEMRKLQLADGDLGPILRFLEAGEVPEEPKKAQSVTAHAKHMEVDEGVLYSNWWPRGGGPTNRQLAVPRGEWKREILAAYHDGPLGGHLGHDKVHDRMRGKYWWPRMHREIRDYVASCPVCQARRPATKKYGLLQPIETKKPWTVCAMDFGVLPKTEAGNENVLGFVDLYSKDVELVATKDQTAETVARHLVDHVICRHGAMEVLVSDQASTFTAELTERVAQLSGIQQRYSVAYHPASHGQIENVFKQTWKILKSYVSKHQRDWDTHLPAVMGVIRHSPNKTTGVSPFKMTHGYDARLPVDTLLPVKEIEMEAERQDTAAARAKILGEELDEMRQHIQKHTEKMQRAMKEQHDRGRTPAGPELDVGQKVLLEVKRPLFAGGSEKLHERWQGPYEVVEKVGELNRKVRGVNNAEDCQMVHVERLKPFLEREDEDSSNDQEMEDGEFEVEEILQERETDGKKEYLVRWKGFTQRSNSWAREADMHADELLSRFKLRPEESRREPLRQKKQKTEAGPTNVPKEKAKEEAPTPAPTKKESVTRSGRRSKAAVSLDL